MNSLKLAEMIAAEKQRQQTAEQKEELVEKGLSEDEVKLLVFVRQLIQIINLDALEKYAAEKFPDINLLDFLESQGFEVVDNRIHEKNPSSKVAGDSDEEKFFQWLNDMLFIWERLPLETVAYYTAYWNVDTGEDLSSFLRDGYEIADRHVDGTDPLTNMDVLKNEDMYGDQTEKEIVMRLEGYPSLAEVTGVALRGRTKDEAKQETKTAAAQKTWDISYRKIYPGNLQAASNYIQSIVDRETAPFPVPYVESILKDRKIDLSVEDFLEKSGLAAVKDAVTMTDGSKVDGIAWAIGIESAKALMEDKPE